MTKKILIILAIVIGLSFLSTMGLRIYTKSFSPIDVAAYKDDYHQIEVTYCQPYKKGRSIFPDVVPYDEVWRTGANESTKISTAQDLKIYDKILPKGTYSIWTIPGQEHWQIIFNKEYGQWGMGAISGEANRDETLDMISVIVPVYQTHNDIEQFTIQFEVGGDIIEMLLMWDHTIVVVPIDKK